MKKYHALIGILIALCIFGVNFFLSPPYAGDDAERPKVSEDYFDYSLIPAFDGRKPYTELNGNVPYFTESEHTTYPFEEYGRLDSLGRCTAVIANVCRDLMPTEEREAIGSVKPTGWQIAKYDFVDGKYLYNRCHLIGFQLTGENANECNLITGTRYLNVEGMLPFENMIADYVRETDNHVLYRVTPYFVGDELVARGVIMEALSMEDGGEGICFNVFCYNVQPKVTIDYATGNNYYSGEEENETLGQPETMYVVNKSSMKFHLSDCPSVKDIGINNREDRNDSRSALIIEGYSPCGACKP